MAPARKRPLLAVIDDRAALGVEEVVAEGRVEEAALLADPLAREEVGAAEPELARDVAEAGACEDAAALAVPVDSTLPLTIESGASVRVVLFCVM